MNWLDDDFSEDRDTESARFRDDGHDHGEEYMRPVGGGSRPRLHPEIEESMEARADAVKRAWDKEGER
jgi:hypothetical protein